MDVEPLLKILAARTGVQFRPAGARRLRTLAPLALPDALLDLYARFEPASVCELGGARLLPVERVVQENRSAYPGCFVSRHGWVVFATNLAGDAFCFDVRERAAAPPIVLIDHEAVGPDDGPDLIARAAKRVARDPRDFLRQLLAGKLDTRPARAAREPRQPSPQDEAAQLRRVGEHKLATREFAGAIEDLTRAIELAPEVPLAHVRRGDARRYLRDFAAAVVDYTRALELEPTLADVWGHRGLARCELADDQGAIDDCARALELDPTRADVVATLGRAKGRSGDRAGGRRDIERAIGMVGPGDGRPMSWRKWLAELVDG